MLNILRAKSYATVVFFLLPTWIGAAAQSVQYQPVARDLVEARLGRYAGNDKQRETTLKQMFIEAGCDEQHISEQPVKGSKQPNVYLHTARQF
jgi:hypothetical protein